MFPVGGYKCMISYYDSISAIESLACLVFGWLAIARHSKTSHGDGGFVYCLIKSQVGGAIQTRRVWREMGLIIMKWSYKVES